jgi:hypothetical protein
MALVVCHPNGQAIQGRPLTARRRPGAGGRGRTPSTQAPGLRVPTHQAMGPCHAGWSYTAMGSNRWAAMVSRETRGSGLEWVRIQLHTQARHLRRTQVPFPCAPTVLGSSSHRIVRQHPGLPVLQRIRRPAPHFVGDSWGRSEFSSASPPGGLADPGFLSPGRPRHHSGFTWNSAQPDPTGPIPGSGAGVSPDLPAPTLGPALCCPVSSGGHLSRQNHHSWLLSIATSARPWTSIPTSPTSRNPSTRHGWGDVAGHKQQLASIRRGYGSPASTRPARRDSSPDVSRETQVAESRALSTMR